MTGWFLRLCDAARHRARRRLWRADEAAGRRGEDLAHRFLQAHGWTVVARNWRPNSGHGEIDLVAWDKGTLVFVEVKSRHTREYGDPERNVGIEKRDALARAGREYARRAGVPLERVRFDVVSVLLANPPSLSLSTDAFRPAATL
jgi:putative endonuclease